MVESFFHLWTQLRIGPWLTARDVGSGYLSGQAVLLPELHRSRYVLRRLGDLRDRVLKTLES